MNEVGMQEDLFSVAAEMEAEERETKHGTMLFTRYKNIHDINIYAQEAEKTAIYPYAMSAEVVRDRELVNDEIDLDDPEMELLVPGLALAYVGLGLGEVGELQGKLKKLVRDGEVVFDDLGKDPVESVMVPTEKLKEISKEIGDCYWYLALLCRELKLVPSEILAENINKLQSRRERGVLGGSGDNR